MLLRIFCLLAGVTSCAAIYGVPHVTQLYSNCTETNLMAGFQEHMADYKAIRQTIFPPHEYDQLETLCRGIPSAAEVAQTYGAWCNMTIDIEKYLKLDVDGFVEAWEFICDRNIYTLADNKECFENMTRMSSASECDEAFRDETWYLNYHEPYAMEKHQERCHASKIYLSCVKSTVNEQCGEDAAEWQHAIHIALDRPYLDSAGCVIGGSFSGGAMTIIGLCTAGGVYVVVLVIVAFVKDARQKKKKQTTKDEDIKKKPSEVA